MRGSATSSQRSRARWRDRPVNIAEELERLQRRRDTGALDEEEFALAKQKLLGTPQPRMSGAISTPRAARDDPETRQWSMFIHLSQFAGYVIVGLGFLLPIILWQVKKTDVPGVDPHGKVVVNWMISQLIYVVVSIPLMLLIVGFPLLIAVIIMGIIFPIIGGIKANEGEIWEYPLTIRFIR